MNSHTTWRCMPLLATLGSIRAWSLALVAILTVTALVAQPAQYGAAQAAPPSAPAKPTIVLEHGAWADSSGWNGVIRRLQHAGYTVMAPPNPLRGLQNDSASLADVLSTITGTIVLVGHSYGGAVITNAATGNPNVKALVYVDAFIPDQGETVLQLLGAEPGSCIGGNPAAVFNAVPYPGAPSGDVDLYIKPSLFPGCFASGVPAGMAAILATTQRPLTLSAGAAPSGPPAWKTIPSWSVIGTADKVIPPAELLAMAQRAHAHITQIVAGHLSLISRPGAVADVIMQAAQATMGSH